MKVVIVGDGKVGGTIARQLSGEGHDIIVIDNNTSVLNNASNTMDIMSVEGNGASMLVQKRAGVPEADLLIAATSADEVNMLACLLGKKLGVPHTIARVRNPEYYWAEHDGKPRICGGNGNPASFALPLCFENRGVCERACGTGRGQDSAPQCAGWDASMGDL